MTLFRDLWPSGSASLVTAARIAGLGDSVLSIGGGGSMQPYRQGASFVNFACLRSHQALRYGEVYGNSGDTTAALLARVATIPAIRKRTPNKWWEIGNEVSREAAEASVKAERERSPDCKFKIREERRQRMFRSTGMPEGETRYIIFRLCEGQG